MAQLIKAYPDAKFILTVRSPESWTESYSETIQPLVAGRDKAPPRMLPWIDWATAVIARTGFAVSQDKPGLIKAFQAHTETVKAMVPASRLLVYEVRQGWEPLCRFLGVAIPAREFPRINAREDFWERVRQGSATPAT